MLSQDHLRFCKQVSWLIRKASGLHSGLWMLSNGYIPDGQSFPFHYLKVLSLYTHRGIRLFLPAELREPLKAFQALKLKDFLSSLNSNQGRACCMQVFLLYYHQGFLLSHQKNWCKVRCSLKGKESYSAVSVTIFSTFFQILSRECNWIFLFHQQNVQPVPLQWGVPDLRNLIRELMLPNQERLQEHLRLRCRI